MANYSDLTRAEQVLFKLQSAEGGWVDGPELANERVGGSEGLKRLRELRERDGWDIRKRKHPDAHLDIYQYRLVPKIEAVELNNGDTLIAHMEMTGDPTIVAVEVDQIIRAEPAETYEYKQPPTRPSRVHLGRTEDGKFVAVSDEPPVLPGQAEALEPPPEVSHQTFKSMPTHLDLAKMRMCPMCKGHRRPVRERDPITNKQMKNGKIIGYEEKSRDPAKPSQDCRWCAGWGVIPL